MTDERKIVTVKGHMDGYYIFTYCGEPNKAVEILKLVDLYVYGFDIYLEGREHPLLAHSKEDAINLLENL